MLSLNCVIFGSTKCKFIKEQEAKGLIKISKGLITMIGRIPLIGPLFM